MPSNPAYRAPRLLRWFQQTDRAAVLRRQQSCGPSLDRPSAPNGAGVAVNPFGRMDHALARIAGRAAHPLLSPPAEILAPVDAPPGELVVAGPGPVAAVFLERSGRKARVDGSIGSAQSAGGDRRGKRG